MIPNLLSIAGFDPSGGAGVAADLKTFAALGCNGMAVITALTAQNTQGVKAMHVPPADFATAQIDAIFDDIEVAAVKIGMLACGAIVEEVADRLAFYKPRFIVLDPVLAATSGDALATSDTATAIVRHLLPLATLITPNVSEAARLSGHVLAADLEGMRRAAILLHARGAKAVLIKGGHVSGSTSDDLLFDGGSYRLFSARALRPKHAWDRLYSILGDRGLSRARPRAWRRHRRGKNLSLRRHRGGRPAFRRPRPWARASFP